MPEAAAVLTQLAKILASPIFSTSPRMSRFLTFIVNEALAGNGHQIKETVLALEVFEKQQNYDPRTDSTVRTEASKLRARLDRYYQEFGQSDSVIISIPKGSYVPVFTQNKQPDSSANNQSVEPETKAVVTKQKLWTRWWFWGSIAAVCAALLVAGGLLLRSHDEEHRAPTRKSFLTTLRGAEWSPTFSPDGSQVAFVWNGDKQDNADIYARVIGVNAGRPLRLTSDPAPDLDPAWSPDGHWIAFRRVTPSEHRIYLVSPLAPGTEQEILTLPCRGGHCSSRLWTNRISWSSDSRFLAISDALSPHSPGNLLLVDTVTHEKQKLDLPPGAAFVSASQPAFLPDGAKLAFVAGETGFEQIYVQTVGKSKQLVGKPRRLVQAGAYPEFDWSEDGHNLICCVSGHCWRNSLDGLHREVLERLIGGTLAIARKGRRLAYSTVSPLGSTVSEIYRVSRETDGSAPLSPSSCPSSSPQYSSDGNRVVFASCRGSGNELWVCSSRGTDCSQLTSFGFAGSPRFSPDGRYVAFDGGKYGSWDIFIADTRGGSPRRFTFENSAESRPSYSSDGRWIYFGSDRSGDFEIWKAPTGGGAAQRVTTNRGYEAVESRDGRNVYYVKRGEQGIWTRPVGGGPEMLAVGRGEEGLWALGARGVYLLSRGAESAIDYFDFQKKSLSRVKVLENANPTAMVGVGPEFAVSPDEQSFLYAKIERNEMDLMLWEDFQ
jgi:Tol biopolymer transport system component